MRVDLLKEAYAVIDGVPDERLDLSRWKCGTLACAGGWLCQYPPFLRMGLALKIDPDYTQPMPAFMGKVYFDALEEFFGIEPVDASGLFGVRRWWLPTESGDTDRQVFLRRLREFLRDKGAITAERCDELAALAEVRKA